MRECAHGTILHTRKSVHANIKFVEPCVPLFSNKFLRNEKINLIEDNEIISTDSELSRILVTFIQKQFKSSRGT